MQKDARLSIDLYIYLNYLYICKQEKKICLIFLVWFKLSASKKLFFILLIKVYWVVNKDIDKKMIQKNNKNDPAGRVPLFDDTRRVPLKMIQKNDPTSYT